MTQPTTPTHCGTQEALLAPCGLCGGLVQLVPADAYVLADGEPFHPSCFDQLQQRMPSPDMAALCAILYGLHEHSPRVTLDRLCTELAATPLFGGAGGDRRFAGRLAQRCIDANLVEPTHGFTTLYALTAYGLIVAAS